MFSISQFMSSHSSPSTDLLSCKFNWEHLTSCHFLAPESSCLIDKFHVHQSGIWNFLRQGLSPHISTFRIYRTMYMSPIALFYWPAFLGGSSFSSLQAPYSAISSFRTNATSSRKSLLICSGKNYFCYLALALFARSI